MATKRKFRVWFDDTTGTLVELSGQLASFEGPNVEREILDDTGTNEDDRTHLAGIRMNTISMNGYINDTSVANAYDLLWDARGTTVSKTVQYYDNVHYYYGEVVIGSLTRSGDGKAIATFAASGNLDGAWTKTSVSQA